MAAPEWAERVPQVTAESIRDIEAPDGYCLLAAILVLQMGVTMAGTGGPSLLWAVANIYVFGTGAALMVVAVSDVDVREHGRPIAGGAALALLVAVTVAWLFVRQTPPETDVALFLGAAVDAVYEGVNPYTVEIAATGDYPTPQMDGTTVSRYSYPYGAVLVTSVTRLAGDQFGRLATILATAALAGVMVYDAPHDLAPLALLSLLIDEFVGYGLIGLIDALWLAPVAAAMHYWPVGGRRPLLGRSAILFGVAVSVKQTPWFIAPFLVVWLLRDRGPRATTAFVAIAAAVFALINGAMVLDAPRAALRGVFTPLLGNGAAPVHAGIGLSSLTMSGVFPVAKWGHTVLVVGAMVVGLAVYYRRPALSWTAWIAFAPLLLLHYRSFPLYVTVAAPLAVHALSLQRTGGPSP
jgi:hypothetical protein